MPAFSGLFAPHWHSEARGVIAGLTSYITKGHLARAVLEATGWQTREVVDAMNADSGLALSTLKVDGGMTADNLLMQLIADVLDVPVVRPMVAETVSLGAAYAAGLSVGYWPDLEGLRRNWHRAGQWLPAMDPDRRDTEYAHWRQAVELTFGWTRPDPALRGPGTDLVETVLADHRRRPPVHSGRYGSREFPAPGAGNRSGRRGVRQSPDAHGERRRRAHPR